MSANEQRPSKRAFIRSYHGEADLFLVYCPETERVYALDIEEAASGKGALHVAPTANGMNCPPSSIGRALHL
jgi:hypothetical protein